MFEHGLCRIIDVQMLKAAPISLPWWLIDDKNSYVMKMFEMRCVLVSEIHKPSTYLPLTQGYCCRITSIASGRFHRMMQTSAYGGQWLKGLWQNSLVGCIPCTINSNRYGNKTWLMARMVYCHKTNLVRRTHPTIYNIGYFQNLINVQLSTSKHKRRHVAW